MQLQAATGCDDVIAHDVVLPSMVIPINDVLFERAHDGKCDNCDCARCRFAIDPTRIKQQINSCAVQLKRKEVAWGSNDLANAVVADRFLGLGALLLC